MPYAPDPEQNGAAKRENQTVMELVRSMIHARNIPPKFWAKATNTAIYVLNQTLSCTLFHTLFKSCYNQKPSLSHLHTFGYPAYIHAEKHTRTKLESKSRPGLFMGYIDESKAYQVWDNTKDKIVITRDVIFHKHYDSHSSPISPIVSLLPLVIIHFPRPPILLPANLVSTLPVVNSSLVPTLLSSSISSYSIPLVPFLSLKVSPLSSTHDSLSSLAHTSTSSDSLNPEFYTKLLSEIFTTNCHLAESDPQDCLNLQLHLPVKSTRISKFHYKNSGRLATITNKS